MAKWGFALSKQEIQLVVQTYVNENAIKTTFKEGKPDDDWFRSFYKRNRLSQKKMEQLEKCRRTATSDPFIIYSFYDRLGETIQQLGLQDKPAHIFNLDETEFNMDPGRIKGVAALGQKVHRSIEGSGKENITTMACISASGVLLPPLIIYQGQNLWSTWKGSNDLEGTCYAVSDKGWMTTAVFNSWFSKFCSIVSERPLLLIMDGHVSHLDRGTIELAIQNNIILFKLPPHATNILQPLDKCCFASLKLKWNQKLTEWQRLNHRRLTKSEFADLICELWNEGITEAIIKKSFESTGIYPCSREKYPVDRLNKIKLQKLNESVQNPNPLDVFELNQEKKNDEIGANNVNNSEQKIIEKETTNETNDTKTFQDNNVKPQPSLSTSFENILLNKISKTNPEIKRRRKVNSSCAVLTSAEYLDSIR
ncbi:uncharacterized protein LOC126745308 [Anthonomus grandis grandis]|uniref:uncharacterized protein LOC126745308 n=1 Tax=Anthonomus grandis grandis TaxID=2921223 RepID=UPI0021662F0F|nr:uncharacterized protein LOC126745308 [Anthonomus grandis grandis]